MTQVQLYNLKNPGKGMGCFGEIVYHDKKTEKKSCSVIPTLPSLENLRCFINSALDILRSDDSKKECEERIFIPQSNQIIG